MRNITRHLISLLHWTKSRHGAKVRPKHWIFGLSLLTALLTWGCPKNDPLQTFNTPPPNDPGPAPVPEPVSALLFGTALLIGGAIVRRRQRNGSHH
jgi:hypothetical protein